MAAHLSQVVLVAGGIAGYFFTIRPINQKEKLEEDMVLLNKQASVRQAEAKSLKEDVERLRENIKGLEVDRQNLAKEQEEATQQLEQQRTKFDEERKALTAAHMIFRQEKERERHAIEARHAELLQSEIARAGSAEQEAMAHAQLLERVQTYERLRKSVTKACLSPQTEIFLDMRSGQINACIHDAAIRSPEWQTLSPDDQARIRQWSIQANHTFRSVTNESAAMYTAFGELVIDELFSSSSPCGSVPEKTADLIELKRPGVIPGARCISSRRMKETIAAFVAHYSALQLSIEAAISGAADRRDPSTSFTRPNAPTTLTVQ